MKKKLITGRELQRFSPWLKRLLIMKMLVILLLVVGLTSSYAESDAQTTKLNLKLQSGTVKDVIQEIERQTDLSFMYDNNVFKVDRPVSIVVENATVQSLVEKLISGENLKYEMVNRYIVITALNPTSSAQQQKSVSGKVTDSSGGALPGVSIVVKGTTNGTISDTNGNYSLPNIPENAIVQFSFVGMKSLEISVGNKSTINAVLIEETIGIEEVVAIGYGTMKKSDLTGSVVKADIEAFRESPNLNVAQSLQGSVAGLNVGMAAEAGKAPSIQIRGKSTISGNQSVLIVLDGIIYGGSINDINPADVESIEILKDASSKAIYGAQAGNGVIIITSKKGKDLGKPLISFSTSYSSVSPTILQKLETREQYLNRVRDVFWETAYTKESGYTQMNPDFNMEAAVSSPESVIGLNNGTNTDWYDLATWNGYIQKNDLSIRGLTGPVSYFFSAGYDKQKNWLINDQFNRKSIRINLETRITDWLKIGTQTFASFNDYSGDSPTLTALVLAGPIRAPYDENGNIYPVFESIPNPLVPVQRDDLDKTNSLFGNFYAKIDFPFIPGLSYSMNYGNNLRSSKKYYSDIYAKSKTGETSKYNETLYDYTIDNIVNYKKSFNEKHNLDLTMVVGMSEKEYENTTALSYAFTNQLLGYNSLEQGQLQYAYSESWEEASSYQMGRLSYNYHKKYLLTTTARRDGFSGFAKNNKSAIFPSVALGWVLSEENFLKKVDAIDNLKLRVSWGINGNLVSRYASLAKVSSSPAYVFGDGGSPAYGHAPSSLPSNYLKWEKMKGVNFGFDFNMLDGLIGGSVDYYDQITNDLLWDRGLPSITGFTSIKTNIGEIQNRGLDVDIDIAPIKTREISWNIGLIFSTNKNTVNKLLGDINGDGKEDDLISSKLFIGESLSAIYDYEIDGIYQIGDVVPSGYTVGGYIVKDNGGPDDVPDGVLSAADRVIIGKSDPAYRFSINNNLSYKNFTLRFFINSIQGGRNNYLGINEPPGRSWLDTPPNAAKHGIYAGIDYWTPSNPDAKFALPGLMPSIFPQHYENRSFVRLQDVSLSYDLDKNVVKRLGLGVVKVYISGKNLYTWSKWEGWDPETGSGMSIGDRPLMKNYTLGLEVTF